MDDDKEWEVERILQERTGKGTVEYLVRWAGYLSEYDQWVLEQDKEHVAEL